MPDAENVGRINIWRNSTVAASAATEAPREIEAFGRMTIYRNGAAARSRRHHEMGGGGGGGGYTAQAVHFDGSTWLDKTTSVAADSGQLTFSLWVRVAGLPPADPGNPWYLMDFDPSGRESGVFLPAFSDDIYGGVTQGWTIVGGNLSDSSAPSLVSTGAWHHLFGYIDTNQDAGSKIIKTYLDGVDITANVGDTDPAFVMNFGSKGWAIPDSSADYPPPLFTGDMADIWVAPGVLETDITIFRDPITGKPKNPSGFPASAILFSGNATTFASNQGTGGAFTLTGSLTNASTSPSD